MLHLLHRNADTDAERDVIDRVADAALRDVATRALRVADAAELPARVSLAEPTTPGEQGSWYLELVDDEGEVTELRDATDHPVAQAAEAMTAVISIATWPAHRRRIAEALTDAAGGLRQDRDGA